MQTPQTNTQERAETSAVRGGAPLRVAVVGMGYVGAVSAAALATRGCRVIGVETHPTKLAQLQQGRAPVSEHGLDSLMRHVTDAGLFTATGDLFSAVAASDVVMVAVGTPSDHTGSVNLDAIDRVTEQLADAVRQVEHPVVVMIRSTVPPGTTGDRVTPTLRQANAGVVVCHHPEFLREGSALRDWVAPAMIVTGSDERDRATVERVIEQLYSGVEAPRLALGTVESEMMKYACNVFHAIKIDFANEVGSLAAAYGADPHAVMHAFCQDRRLNISPAYLKPGFAFGGSCLPKDTRTLQRAGRELGLDLPLIDAVLASNERHLARQLDRVLHYGRATTLLVGLTFKPGTDDLRESPMVELAERLLGKGVPLSIHDPDLAPDTLVGANKAFIARQLPQLEQLLCNDLSAALRRAEVVVIAKPIDGLSEAMLRGKHVVDLTRTLGMEWSAKARWSHAA